MRAPGAVQTVIVRDQVRVEWSGYRGIDGAQERQEVVGTVAALGLPGHLPGRRKVP